MKKSILAVAGLAAVAGVVGPVAGAFAADGNLSTTDTVKVTIDSACSLTATGNTNAYTVTMTNSSLKSDIGSTTINIKCNDASGWNLTAVGAGEATDKTEMKAGDDGTNIVTGKATSGANSNWAFKVTGDKAMTAYTSFAEIPSTAAKVAGDNSETNMTNGTNLTTTYQVWISATQEADTYTGKVTYTLSHPASS